MLRPLEAGDLDDLFAYASDPEVARYTSWPAHGSVEDSRAFLDYVLEQYQRGEVAPWGVVNKAGGRLVGTCGFLDWVQHAAWAEIGYALSSRFCPGA